MDLAEVLWEKVRLLPVEQQREVLAFVEQLEQKRAAQRVDPYGSCADIRVDLSFEEFAENRRQMWGDATEREIE